MTTRIIIALAAIAVLVATFFIDSRLTPIVGAFALFGAIVYAWAANRREDAASFSQAERATRSQKRNHSGPRS